MKRFLAEETPGTSYLQDISYPEALELFGSFSRKVLRIPNATIDIEMLERFISVAHYRTPGARDTGWIVGGRMPFLYLSDEEIETPIEALAIYSHLCFAFVNPRVPPEGRPDYRIAPDWEPLTVDPGYEESRIGGICTYLSWRVVSDNPDEIRNPEIREMCLRRGWLKRVP